MAVKLITAPVTEAESAPAEAFEDAARRHGVPAPAVRRTRSGAVLTRVSGRTFRVSSWVDLRPADIDLDVNAVARLVASLHTVPTEPPHSAAPTAVHPWYLEPVGAPGWDGLVSRCLRSKAPFADSLAAHRSELVALQRLLSPPTAIRTCHRDLFADNVRASETGEICIIDFDNSGPADPSQELAFVLVEFATDAAGAVDGARAAALLEAYAAAGGPGRLTRPQSFSMVVAVLGHLAELGIRRWLAAPDRVSRATAEAMVQELLGRPLTRQVVDELLTSA